MTHIHLQFFSVIFAMLITALPPRSGQASFQSHLDSQVENFEVVDQSIDQALDQLSKEYQLAIGVELHQCDSSPGPQNTIVSVNVHHARARDALNAVINAAGGRYQWEEDDWVVNVIPTSADKSFLDTAVSTFFIIKEDRIDAIKRLLAWREVPVALQRLGLTRRDRVSRVEPPDPRLIGFSLPLKDTTVRKALNEILRGSQSRYWVVSRYGDRYQYFSLNMW